MRSGNEFLLFAAADRDAAGTVTLRAGNVRAGKRITLGAGECILLRFDARGIEIDHNRS
jgi:hypothetical protein